MSVSRLLVCASVLVLVIGVSVTGQQQPAAAGGATPSGAGATRAGSGDAQRGQYLVERVVMCYECHSTRDGQGNIVPGTRFMGGPMPLRPAWPGWPTQIPRIAGFAGYTDDEAMRVLTGGAIKRDGTQLRLPMPRFRMTPQDAADVIAYLRTT
jgi:mono/diheme cytochrome c family protein